MEIDWENAPEWAKWHTFDSDGEGFFWADDPKRGLEQWWEYGLVTPSGLVKPTDMDWRQSLTKREEKQHV